MNNTLLVNFPMATTHSRIYYKYFHSYAEVDTNALYPIPDCFGYILTFPNGDDFGKPYHDR